MGQSNLPEAATGPHQPVLLAEVLQALAPLAGARLVDGTFGAGGYSRALLEHEASVTAIDRDPSVAGFAETLAARFPDRFRFVCGNFSALDTLAGAPADGVVLDIGVSSMQFDQSERGFSFMREGALDMRMSGEGPTAADLVNTLTETELANLIFAYGEERGSRRIARAIMAARAQGPITTTTGLASIVEGAIGRRPGGIHPATRTFQALRIAVNAELDELVMALFASERLLGEGGRLAIVSFHSLEDRIVKRFLDPSKTAAPSSRHAPAPEAGTGRRERPWSELRKPVRPGAEEVRRNPRARSAVLRSAIRSAAPARPAETRGLGVPRWSAN